MSKCEINIYLYVCRFLMFLHNFCSMSTFWKGRGLKMVLKGILGPQMGLWPTPDWGQSPKISNMWHDGTPSIRNCTLMMSQLKNSSFEPLCSEALAISGHNQTKVPKLFIYSMIVLYRSEIACWWWPNLRIPILSLFARMCMFLVTIVRLKSQNSTFIAWL
jgi:hypothetical protein